MLIPSHLFVEIPECLMTDATILSPFHLKCQDGSRHILLHSELSLMNAGQHPPTDVPKIIFSSSNKDDRSFTLIVNKTDIAVTRRSLITRWIPCQQTNH